MTKPEKADKNWIGSKVKCDLCGYAWVAVYHKSSEKLECPNCKNMVYYD